MELARNVTSSQNMNCPRGCGLASEKFWDSSSTGTFTVVALLSQALISVVLAIRSIILSASGKLSIDRGTNKVAAKLEKTIAQRTGDIEISHVIGFLREPLAVAMMMVSFGKALFDPVEALAYAALTIIATLLASYIYKLFVEELLERMLCKEDRVVAGDKTKHRNYDTLNKFIVAVSFISSILATMAFGPQMVFVFIFMFIVHGRSLTAERPLDEAYNISLTLYGALIFISPGSCNKFLGAAFIYAHFRFRTFGLAKSIDFDSGVRTPNKFEI